MLVAYSNREIGNICQFLKLHARWAMQGAQSVARALHALCAELQRRDAEAAAVRVTASGSQQSTIRAISHRIAFSLSASIPKSSATYRMGAASVSIRLP